MPTRAFCPPESWCGQRVSRSAGSPTISARLSTRLAISALSCLLPSLRTGSAMQSKAGQRGFRLSVGSWNTIWIAARQGEAAKSLALIAAITLAV
jgi:hypothetical protein